MNFLQPPLESMRQQRRQCCCSVSQQRFAAMLSLPETHPPEMQRLRRPQITAKRRSLCKHCKIVWQAPQGWFERRHRQTKVLGMMTCSATVRLSVKNAIAPAQIKKLPVASKKDLQAQTPAQCSMGIWGASAALYAFILQAAHLGRLAARQQSAFFFIGIVPNVSLQPKCRPSLLEGQSTIAATALCCDVYSPEMHPPEMQRCLKTKPLQATDTLTISISASTPVNLVPNVLAMLIEGRSTAQHQQHTPCCKA